VSSCSLQLIHGDHDYISSACPRLQVLASSTSSSCSVSHHSSDSLSMQLKTVAASSGSDMSQPYSSSRGTPADGVPPKPLGGVVGFNTRSGFVKMTDTVATTSVNVEVTAGGSVISPSSLSYGVLPRGEMGESEASVGGGGGSQKQKSAAPEHHRIVEYRLQSHFIASIPEAMAAGISMPIKPRSNKRTKLSGYRPTGSNNHVYSTGVHRMPMPSTAIESDFKFQQQYRLPATTFVTGSLPHHQVGQRMHGPAGTIHSVRTSPKKSLLELKPSDCNMSSPASRLTLHHQSRRSSVDRSAVGRLNTVSVAMMASTIGRRHHNAYFHHPNRHLVHHQSLLITPPGIPSPFLLQTGLEKALDFAEFQPMSPSSISSLSPPPRDQIAGVAASACQSTRSSFESVVASGRRHPMSCEVTGCLHTGSDATKCAAQNPAVLSVFGKDEDPLSTRCRQLQPPYGILSHGVYDALASPSAQILVGDIDADGCYWDGLQCEEEQIDQWQTTVWNGGNVGCHSNGDSRLMTAADFTASSAAASRKSSSTNSSTAMSHGGDKRKRRLTAAADYWNHVSGGRGGKHKRLHGDTKSIGFGKPTHRSSAIADNGSHMGEAIVASRSGQVINASSFAPASAPKKSHKKHKDPGGEMLDRSMQQHQQPRKLQSVDMADITVHSGDSVTVKTEKLSTLISPSTGFELATSSIIGSSPSMASSTRHRRRKFDRRKSVRSRTLEQCSPTEDVDASTRSTTAVEGCSGVNGSELHGMKRVKENSKRGASSSATRTKSTSSSKFGKQQNDSTSRFPSKTSSKGKKRDRQRNGRGFVEVGQMYDGVTDVGEVFGQILTEWERYLTFNEEELLAFEVENARYFQYSDEAMAMIADRDLEVWRIVEKMRPNLSLF